jgi:hypothetical protein
VHVETSNKKRKRFSHAEETYRRAEYQEHRRADREATTQNHIDNVNKRSVELVLASESLARREVNLKQLLQKAKKEMRHLAELADATDLKTEKQWPDPLFRCGQTVLQYWARWFAAEPLDSGRTVASKKDRPNWYIGEVLAGPELKCITYGGVRVEEVLLLALVGQNQSQRQSQNQNQIGQDSLSRIGNGDLLTKGAMYPLSMRF